MPCFTQTIIDNQIRFVCGIGKANQPSTPPSKVREIDPFPFIVLLDTGAQRTCITKNVVDKVGLTPSGWGTIQGVGGLVECGHYMVNLTIPMSELSPSKTEANQAVMNEARFEKIFSDIEVFLLPEDHHSFDVLLGMDIIQMCHFSVHSGELFTLCI